MSAYRGLLLPCEDRNHGPAPLLWFLFPSPGAHYGSLSSRALCSGKEGEWGRERKGGKAEAPLSQTAGEAWVWSGRAE